MFLQVFHLHFVAFALSPVFSQKVFGDPGV